MVAQTSSRALELEITEVLPGLRMVKIVQTLAGSALLSREQMQTVGRALGSKVMAVSVPSRDCLLAVAYGASASKEGVKFLGDLTARLFREAGFVEEVSRALFQVSDGQVIGRIGGPTIMPVPPTMEQATVRARCLVEVSLYLELLMTDPARREIARIELRDAVVHWVRTRRIGTTEDFDLLFEVADPDGTLGETGDPRPSELLDPSDLLKLARFYAKQVPITRAERSADARDEHTRASALAIACVEEILKFIPPGTAAVPSTAFATDEAKQAYQASPLQFSREMLDVQLRAYREILARLAAS